MNAVGISARNGRPIGCGDTSLPAFTRLRLDRGYSQQDIADGITRLGCKTSVNTIGYLERGYHELNARRMVALAIFFNLSLDDVAALFGLLPPERRQASPRGRGAALEL